MVWPFSRKLRPTISPEVDAVFEKLWLFLNDEREQLGQYPDMLKEMALAGADADENPGASGSFGTTWTNPIPVNGPIGEILYLSALRVRDKRIIFHKIKSIDAIDVYECVSLDGFLWGTLYLDMYHPRKSRKAPDGYTIATSNALLSGINAEIPNFPDGLYEQIVAYSEKRFGMSIADPAIRLELGRLHFERPLSHLARLKQIKW
jgi:hypothetical protein